MLSTRPRSVKPNVRWRSARRRSNEKSARAIRREVAGSQQLGAALSALSIAGSEAPMVAIVPRYGNGTGPRAQQAKRAR